MSNNKLRHLRTYESIAPEGEDKNRANAMLQAANPNTLHVVDSFSEGRDPFEVKYVFGVDLPAFEDLQLEVLVTVICEIADEGQRATYDDPGSGPSFDRDIEFAINAVKLDDEVLLDAVEITDTPNIEAVKQAVENHLRADIDWEKYENLAWDNR